MKKPKSIVCKSNCSLIIHLIGYMVGQRSIGYRKFSFRELGVNLDIIRDIINQPHFDGLQALKEHREKSLAKRERLDLLIANVDKTIALREGRITMTDEEKFAGFKEEMINDNERKYGKEIR